MNKKPFWLALPLAAGLALAGCAGSADDDGASAPASSASPAASSSPAAPSEAAAASDASGDAASGEASDGASAKAGGAALGDAELKKIVSEYFEAEESAQILGGETLRKQAGAAGELVANMKVSPAKCNTAAGIDVAAAMKKSNIAVGAVANPKNPTQTASVTLVSAKNPAEAESTFTSGLGMLEDCKRMTIETMGVKVKVTTEVADVDVTAPASLAIRTTTEAQGQKIPGASVTVFDKGLQVQIQQQGEKANDATLQDMADDAQQVLEEMKAR